MYRSAAMPTRGTVLLANTAKQITQIAIGVLGNAAGCAPRAISANRSLFRVMIAVARATQIEQLSAIVSRA
jgi:hypothetical protein